jgi:hypothetical protein
MFSEATCNANLERALTKADSKKRFDYYQGFNRWLGETETYRNYTAIYLGLSIEGLGPGKHLRQIAGKVYSLPLEVNSVMYTLETILALLPGQATQRAAAILSDSLAQYLPESIAEAQQAFSASLPDIPQPLVDDIFGYAYPNRVRSWEIDRLKRVLKMITPYLPN